VCFEKQSEIRVEKSKTKDKTNCSNSIIKLKSLKHMLNAYHGVKQTLRWQCVSFMEVSHQLGWWPHKSHEQTGSQR